MSSFIVFFTVWSFVYPEGIEPFLQLDNPRHEGVERHGFAVDVSVYHVVVVVFAEGFQRFAFGDEGDGLGIVQVVVDVSQVVELAAVLHDGAVESGVQEGGFAVGGVHKFLQVVEVAAHSTGAGFIFLEFFVEEEGFLQEGTSRSDGADDAREVFVQVWDAVVEEAGDGLFFKGLRHRKAADLYLDAWQDVAFVGGEDAVVVHHDDGGVAVGIDGFGAFGCWCRGLVLDGEAGQAHCAEFVAQFF